MLASPSCAIFEKFSNTFHWILANKFNVKHLSHILDDFMFFGHPQTHESLLGIKSFLALSESIVMPVKAQNTVWPCTSIELHSILFDSISMTMSLPLDKVGKAKDLIDSLFK